MRPSLTLTPPAACGAPDSELFGATGVEPARQRLLLAGLKLFADQGFAKTSIRQIAVEAGANVAAVSYYFGNKVGLYRAVFFGGHAPELAEASRIPQALQLNSLDELFERVLQPLRSGQTARSWMKMQRREMLEPTGLWQEKVDRGMVPVHAALVAYLCRRLGLGEPDDEVRALALLVIGPAVHLLVNCEAVDMIAPQLLADADAVDAWRERLSRSAEAIIEAERRRRLAAPPSASARPTKAARAAAALKSTPAASRSVSRPVPRSSRSKA